MSDKAKQILEILKGSTYREILGTISTVQGIIDADIKNSIPLQDREFDQQ